VQSYSRALGDVARSLNAVKGRKNIILFSEGFDSRLFLGRETFDVEAENDNRNITNGLSYLVDTDARYGNTNVQAELNRCSSSAAPTAHQSVDIGGLRDTGATRKIRASAAKGCSSWPTRSGELFKDANNLRDPLEVLTRSLTYPDLRALGPEGDGATGSS
jgi:hypothetical protein